ncbi:MAG: NAD(P)-dependent oxidoreductase [Verrucomicrobiota bacterium]
MANNRPDPAEPVRKKSFPVAWVTSGRELLIVGGCMNNLCRLKHAIQFDWETITVATPPDEAPMCETCLADPRVTLKTGGAEEEDVRRASLVIECTMDQDVGEQAAALCRDHKVPINAMDKLELCDLHYPALMMRGPLILAIISGGAAPALSSRLRTWLEEHLGPGWDLAARLFSETRNRLPGGQSRSDLLKKLANDPRLFELIEENNEMSMREWIDDEVNRM